VDTAGFTATGYDFSNNALSQTTVDDILLALDNNGQTNKIVYLDGGTNSAPTGGASNPNKLSLEGKGWTVNINP